MKKLTYEFVKEQIEKEGYKLLSKEYKSCSVHLNVRCDNGHEYEVSWDNFKQGYKCPVCFGSFKHTLKYIKNRFNMINYTLLSESYNNAHAYLNVRCDKGHEYETTYNNFQQGKRCLSCNIDNVTSKSEIEIQKFITLYRENVDCNNRNVILNPLTGRYLELDVYLPDLNKAIEFNGTYWHSFDDAIIRDKIKQKECKKLGIELMVIQEQDYINNKEMELNKIKEFINV